MNESLVIRLDPEPRDTAAWVTVDQTGALLSAPAAGQLTEAASAAAGRQVIALLPAVDVLRTCAEVPLRTGAKLLQALPFALEDQLADDIEALHFAAGSRDPEGRVPVAVVRREAMSEWTKRLSDAGLAPSRAYSESDAIAGMPNTATLVVEDERALLTDVGGASTAIDCGNLEAFLDLWIAQQRSGDQAAGLHLVVYGTPDALASLGDLWVRLQPELDSLDVRTLVDGVLPRLAAQIVTGPGVNLLQGDFARRTGLGSYWPAWRPTALLLAVLAVAALAVQFLELRRLQRESADLDAAIDQAFHYVFPDAGAVVDARAELSARLRQIGEQGTGGPREFLEVLRTVAQAMGGVDSARIEGLSYRPGTMELRLRAPDVDALDRIEKGVTQAGGVRAQIQSANSSGDFVVGRMQISRPAN